MFLRVVNRVNSNGLDSTAHSWRNWNFYQGNITQDIMEANFRAMSLKRGPAIGGESKNLSLIDVGYRHAGLDDNWQVANCVQIFGRI